MARLALPTVTLCAAASINVSATIEALNACLDQIEFAQGLLFTDAEIPTVHRDLRVVRIARLASGSDYSEFLLRRLVDHVTTSHCLVVQWDGFVLDARQWSPEFLECDYIGAPWPQFDDGLSVGNGGFSLRSRRLLEACLDPRFLPSHPEDVAICRTNRPLLEQAHGIRFADRVMAERFAFERTDPRGPTFGFHGIFNMIPTLGPERFREIYRTLDNRDTAFVDYPLLMRQLGGSRNSSGQRAKLTMDRIAAQFGRRAASRGQVG